MRLSMRRIFLLGELMKKINEHFYIISQDEITEEMESVKEGLYVIKNDFYEVEKMSTIKSNIITTNETRKIRAHALSDRIVFFIFAILFLCLAVICIYNMANCIKVYNEVAKIKDNINGTAFNTYFGQTADEIWKNSWMWFLGGIASFVVGTLLSFRYHKYMN